MSYQPPRWLEYFAELLLPPSNAEHVLGDIAESSDSKRSYFMNLLSVLPGAVWCQIRRRCHKGVTIFNLLLSAYVMGAMQAWLYNAYLDEPKAWLRLAVPFSIWVVGGVLAAAYGPAAKPTHASGRGLIATFLAALGSAALLGVPVPGVAAALMTIVAFWAAVAVLFGMPFIKYGTPGPLSTGTVLQHARLFQSGIWWRNLRESLAAVVVLAFQVPDLLEAVDPMVRLSKFVLIAGVLFVIGYLNLVARPRALPEAERGDTIIRFHRAELVRQRNILRSVPLWYLFPFVPGLVLGVFAERKEGESVFGLAILAVVFALVWWLNRYGASYLDKQIQQVDALTMDASNG